MSIMFVSSNLLDDGGTGGVHVEAWCEDCVVYGCSLVVGTPVGVVFVMSVRTTLVCCIA